MTRVGVNRREFLKGSGAAAVVAASSPVLTSVPAAAAGANDRIRYAVIGCGGQGRRSHIGRFPQGVNAEIVAVCDPDESRRAQASTEAGGAEPVDDLRRILDDPAVDAVTIATPDHWHTPAAIMALDAGKHVYLEKPCSHNLREGRLLVEAARKSGRVLQHGTQARSSRGFVEAVRMLHDGVIGDVLVAKAWNVQKRRNIGRERPGSPPDGFDYDLWVGPAPMVPFQKNRHHYSWHWWYHFGTGDLGTTACTSSTWPVGAWDWTSIPPKWPWPAASSSSTTTRSSPTRSPRLSTIRAREESGTAGSWSSR